MASIEGTCDDRFAAVRNELEQCLDAGDELGASIVVDLDGEVAVDLWGGHRDEARTQPWQRDTITNVWSSTKTVTSLAALILVDRGELDVDSPVARYWPEFGAAGKQDVLVRHLLSHTSGGVAVAVGTAADGARRVGSWCRQPVYPAGVA